MPAHDEACRLGIRYLIRDMMWPYDLAKRMGSGEEEVKAKEIIHGESWKWTSHGHAARDAIAPKVVIEIVFEDP